MNTEASSTEGLPVEEGIQNLARFFEPGGQGRFLFAVADDEDLLTDVNNRLLALLEERQIVVHLFSWHRGLHREWHPLLALKVYLEQHPGAQGLIFTELSAALGEDEHPQLLTQLNFAREGLHELGRPLLFWASSQTLDAIVRQAMDLYDQRAGATLFFGSADAAGSAAASKAAPHLYSLQEQREARGQLLREQLSSAEKKRLPPPVIAQEIALPLIELYAQLPEAEARLRSLLERYAAHIDVWRPEIALALARAYHYVQALDQAEAFYGQALLECRTRAAALPQAYLHLLAAVLDGLAELHRDRGALALARQYQEEAAQARREADNQRSSL